MYEDLSKDAPYTRVIKRSYGSIERKHTDTEFNPHGLFTIEIPVEEYYALKHTQRDFLDIKRLLGIF